MEDVRLPQLCPPLGEPTKFNFAINGRTAEPLGLTVPQSLFLHGAEVIQRGLARY